MVHIDLELVPATQPRLSEPLAVVAAPGEVRDASRAEVVEEDGEGRMVLDEFRARGICDGGVVLAELEASSLRVREVSNSASQAPGPSLSVFGKAERSLTRLLIRLCSSEASESVPTIF